MRLQMQHVARALVLTALLATITEAQSFQCGTPVYWGVNGHYYQRCNIPWVPGGTAYSFHDVDSYARSRSLAGLYGHLVTPTSQSEWDFLNVHGMRRGLVPAIGGNCSYVWINSPEAGTAILNYYGGLFCQEPPCPNGPFNRLEISSAWVIRPSFLVAGGSWGCNTTHENFTIEYSPDLLPPSSHVTYPNESGEQLVVGDVAPLEWEAFDAFGRLASIDIQLSRSGAAGPFEDIAVGLPPGAAQSTRGMIEAALGTYQWVVTGPPTANAVLRVVAHDEAGNTSADISDSAFTIVGPVPVHQRSWGRMKLLYR